jgi:CTP synthase (UTP-ammonia lyase)
MPEVSKETMGGTMRLGARKTLLEEGSLAMDIYNNDLLDDESSRQSKKNSIISERHRLGYLVLSIIS